MLARGLAAVMGVVAVGCAYRTPAAHFPPSLPQFAVSDRDLRVEVVSDGHARLEARGANGYRPWVIDILSDAKRARAASTPARVTVRVTPVNEDYWMKACPVVCLFPALAGVSSGYATVAVDVTIETDQRRYFGHGSATRSGGLYAPADKRALAAAIDHALAQAAPVTRARI
jgi:hypothetical protein